MRWRSRSAHGATWSRSKRVTQDLADGEALLVRRESFPGARKILFCTGFSPGLKPVLLNRLSDRRAKSSTARARSISAAFSSSKVRPGLHAIARIFASAATRSVSVPITGTSKRMSWFGFVTLITMAFFFPNEPPRRIASFVPSNASTARTVPFFTTIVWPTSSALSCFAISKPKAMSSSSRSFNFGPAMCPPGASR